MPRKLPIVIQEFDDLVSKNLFYVDKSEFIKSWWDVNDKVTLITRPRRFGKTSNLSMVNCFFSVQYKNGAELFQNLKIWQYEEYRQLQGTCPVIFCH